MEEWQKDFFQAVETLAGDVEKFFSELANEVSDATELIIQASEEITEQVQEAFFSNSLLHWTNDVLGENFFSGQVEPLLNHSVLWLEEAIDEAIATYPELDSPWANPEDYLMRTSTSALQEHPACVGCQHYHGQAYGGTLLVCGMHPYGWQEEQCPDWQSTWE
ncbi:MAG: hypothetical protein KME16_07470 [Scytolyngbya sp. HA4215-MV1]|jgi:hypothetical protein|nr:hypothetical protein [Scytolyngbya sp. HA4215-MV1]